MKELSIGSWLRQSWQSLSAATRSGILMITATGVLAGMHTLIRYLSKEIHPFEIAFFRSFFGLIVLSPFVFVNGISMLKTGQPGLNLIRGTTSMGAMLAWFYGLSVVELAKATTLSFTNTLFGSIAAIFLLGEKLVARRVTALLLGFTGVLIVLRPGLIEVSSGSIIVLFSAICWGIGLVIVKQLTRTDGTVSIILWFTIFTSLLTFPFALANWNWPAPMDFFWLLLMGLLGSLGHLAAVSGIKLSDASSVMPMDFTRLIWVSLFGFLFFGEIPEIWTWIGASVILSSTGILMVPSSRKG